MGIDLLIMKSAQEMLQEMYESGMTEQAIADLTIPSTKDIAAADHPRPVISQAQVNRIRSGVRKDPRSSTYVAINDAYLKWQADKVLAAAKLERDSSGVRAA